MISLIGNRRQRKEGRSTRATSFGLCLCSREAFTLVEVMVAVAILSFGVTMIFNAFFICSDAITYASNRLNAQMWAHDKTWRDHDSLLRLNNTLQDDSYGTITFNGRNFDWQRSIQRVEDGVTELSLVLSWKEAARQRKLAYSTYLAL